MYVVFEQSKLETQNDYRIYNDNTSLVKMKWILLLTCLYSLQASSRGCNKEFSYNYVFGYGYTITCDHTNYQELYNISVFNEISLTVTDSIISVDRPIFHNIQKIRELNISRSLVNYTQDSVHAALTELEKLILVGDQIKSLKRNFLDGLRNLKVLNLGLNQISGFEPGTFKAVANLRELNLAGNKIKSPKLLQLCDLEQLKVLVLSGNQIESNYYGCLSNLGVLNLDYNKLTKLDNLSSATLNELSARYNSILDVSGANATSLVKLNLQGNKINRVLSKNFSEFINLSYLNLNNNSLVFVDPDAFRSNLNLLELNLDSNSLVGVSLKVKSLFVLSLSRNRLKAVAGKDFQNLTSLTRVDLSHNEIERVDRESFEFCVNLKEIDLSGNKLEELDLVFNTSSLERLNLNRNRFKFISGDWFKYVKSLKVLDLSVNLINSLNATAFKDLGNLEGLNVSYNKLLSLDYEVLRPLVKLSVLDIEGNMLKTIDFRVIWGELPNLDGFNVQNNLFTCEFIAEMIKFFKHKEIKFNLNEHLKYDEDNVEGIYCKETEAKRASLDETIGVVMNNSLLIHELYDLSVRQRSTKISTTVIVLVGLVVLSVLVVALCLVYKYSLLLKKRRNYIMDELELIDDSTPYKRFDNK